MKRIINWIGKIFKEYTWQKSIAYIIGVIVGIFFGISFFMTIDKVPATTLDYEALENQIVAIQKDQSLLFTTDCELTVKDKETTITLENEECKLIVKLDSNLNVLNTKKEDLATSLGKAIFLSMLIGIMLGFVIGLVFWIVSWITTWILRFLIWLVKTIYRQIFKHKR